MRRLPIYFLVDVSESMIGEPVEEMYEGMCQIIQDLRVDPYALETVYISVIVFAGKPECFLPLTELTKFNMPTFPVGSGTSLGKAITFLMNELDHSIQKTTAVSKGDWKPLIFLFTDGVPTDDPDSAIKKWNKTWRKHANLVAFSIGKYGDTVTLSKLTDNVLRLTEVDRSSFHEFFKWISASIKASSVSVNEYSSDDLKLPPLSRINLEKVTSDNMYAVDENFAVFSGKCSTTKKMYLLKYARNIAGDSSPNADGAEFKLVGGYPIDEATYRHLSDSGDETRKLDTSLLSEEPPCPCCGAEGSMLQCGNCGKISCCDPHSKNFCCPWCGTTGTIRLVDHLDLSRERG